MLFSGKRLFIGGDAQALQLTSGWNNWGSAIGWGNSCDSLGDPCVGVDEPLEQLLCCIHPKDFNTIQNLYFEKNSLIMILLQLNAIKIVIVHPNKIKSFDTLMEFSSF